MASLPPTIPSGASRCLPSVSIPLCSGPDNAAAQCTKAEVELWSRIAFNPTFPLLRLPPRYRALSINPFDAQPYDAIRLNVQGASGVLSGLTAGAYNPIVSYLVPPGFDGVINNTMNRFAIQNGPGLQDGSGMITWLIQINNYLQLNYTNITMQMGDQVTLGPTSHHGGIRIRANDLITMYAVVSNAGLAFLDPAGLILGAFQGWIYSSR